MLATRKQALALVSLFRSGTKLSYKKGEFIIRPNETPSGVFYIEEGLVKAFDITKYGEENLLIIRKEKEVFPIIRAITGKGRSVMYQTLSPVTVWRIEQEKYVKFLSEHSEVIPPLLDLVIEMYQIHSERIINLEYRSVRERLISFLLTMSGRFGTKHENGVMIDVPLKHQDIASSINASRETANRELSRLVQRDLISYEQSKIIIKDAKTLRSFL